MPYFYPRSPCGERQSRIEPDQVPGYFYPRSPCGERHRNIAHGERQKNISIHALLAESDQLYDTYAKVLRVFLSTLSLRRATSADCNYRSGHCYFYPRSPCGERQHAKPTEQAKTFISIHALLAESDANLRQNRHRRKHFYPRSPCGERPDGLFFLDRMSRISIHALLAESDGPYHVKRHEKIHFYPRSPCGERRLYWLSLVSARHFYPRSPCGERLLAARWVLLTQIFLSTLSLRRATQKSLNP